MPEMLINVPKEKSRNKAGTIRNFKIEFIYEEDKEKILPDEGLAIKRISGIIGIGFGRIS